MASSSTPSKMSRLSCPKIRAKQPAVSITQPAARIPTPSSHSVLKASGATLTVSINSRACIAPRRRRFPLLVPDLFERVALHDGFDIGRLSQRHIPTGDVTSIPVPRRQGRIPPFRPFFFV